MIGGGPGSFIGAVHRIALRMDGHYEMVAGAFSSTHEKCWKRQENWEFPKIGRIKIGES